jgi:lysozyme family protein
VKINFANALGLTLRHEGGFVSHPKDPGGATNKGITLATFSLYLGRKASVDELKMISDTQLCEIYRKQYWDKVRGDDLPGGLDFCVFDFAVNSGPGRAAKVLQALVGAEADGSIGHKTVAAVLEQVSRETLPKVIEQYQAKRLHYLQALPHWETFGKGWGRRVNEVLEEAMLMMKA